MYKIFLVLTLVGLLGCVSSDEPNIGVHKPPITKELKETSLIEFSKNPILVLESGMHTSMINRMGIDPNGKFLVTPSDDRTLRIWDLRDGKLMKVFRIPIGYDPLGGQIQAASVSPDGKTIAMSAMKNDWETSDSIYILNLNTEKIEKKIIGIPNVPMNMDFSDDGSLLAVSMAGNGGIIVYRASDYSVVFKDYNYNGRCMGIDFSDSGKLVVASEDGFVRLYDSRFKIVAKRKVQYGRGIVPYHVKFNNDGSFVAVGIKNSVKVSLLEAKNLKLIKTLKVNSTSKQYYGSSIWSVSWSKDSKYLYAGGRFKEKDSRGNWKNYIYRWDTDSFQDKPTKLVTENGTIISLLPFSAKGILYTTMSPSWGAIDENGRKIVGSTTPLIDFRNKALGVRGYKKVLVSDDALTISYFNGDFVDSQKYLSLFRENERAKTENLFPPKLKSQAISITNWTRHDTIKLNGKKLNEIKGGINCYAISNNEKYVVFGSGLYIYGFDKTAKMIWKRGTPGEVWGLNISKNRNVFVASYTDGTFRWHDLLTGKELLAFFPHADGKRWVLWTPEGFFDHSSGGEKLIGYHINLEKNKLSQFIDISQMYDFYYRPDLILKKIKGNHQSEIYEASERIGNVRSSLAMNLPPRIEIMNPETTVKNRDIILNLRITDNGGGLGKIVYRINGVTIRTDEADRFIKVIEKKSDFKSIKIQKLLTLQPGSNRISVSAFNKNNTIESQPDSVHLTLKDAISNKPSLYILAVGINRYRDKTLWLNYAVQDGKELVSELRRSGGDIFQSIVVKEIYDDHATLSNIESTFNEIAKTDKTNDVFVLFMAGHGLTLDGRYHFVPVDFRYHNEDSVRQKAINQDYLQKWLAQLDARKSLILLDTCNSGSYVQAQAVTRGLVEKTAIDKLTRATGRATIAASTDTQVALEGIDGHGVFTFALIKALSKADQQYGNRDGVVSTSEIASFVNEQVPELTYQKWGYEQVPQVNLHGREFPIGVSK